MDFVERFAAELRARAVDRKKEDSPAAGVYSRVADEMLDRFNAWLAEELTNEQAARESGYHRNAISLMRTQGRWSGRRGDLPRKARAPKTTAGAIALVSDAPKRGRRSLAEEIAAREHGVSASGGGR